MELWTLKKVSSFCNQTLITYAVGSILDALFTVHKSKTTAGIVYPFTWIVDGNLVHGAIHNEAGQRR